MKKKLVVLGSTGLIGHRVYYHLDSSDKYNMFNISYRKKLTDDTILIDVRNEAKFIDTLVKIKPDIIVNCIGILISGSNKDPENSIFINAYIPHRLARISNEINAKLIHISTDCVFSGRKNTPYIENDEKDGLDTYAKTKGIGEIISHNHLTLRTSVVGPELKTDGEELFHWFMMQSGKIHGYTKSIWSGVTTLELAKAVKWAIEHNITGLYHITNGKSINKYDLLILFKKYTEKEILIEPVEGRKVDKSLVDTRKEIDYRIPDYEDMIDEMVAHVRKNQSMYPHYS